MAGLVDGGDHFLHFLLARLEAKGAQDHLERVRIDDALAVRVEEIKRLSDLRALLRGELEAPALGIGAAAGLCLHARAAGDAKGTRDARHTHRAGQLCASNRPRSWRTAILACGAIFSDLQILSF